MSTAKASGSPAQKIWAIALILAGIGVFYRVPQVLPKVAQIDQFSDVMGIVRFCFYLMGVLLIGGGIMKIIRFGWRAEKTQPGDD